MIAWYFGFHRPASLREVRAGKHRWTTLWGHVEAWGFNADDTWTFIDPQAAGTRVLTEHRHDDVIEMLGIRNEICRAIYRVDRIKELRFPPLGPVNCVSICASLVGIRAFTANGFQRKLRASGAEKVK